MPGSTILRQGLFLLLWVQRGPYLAIGCKPNSLRSLWRRTSTDKNLTISQNLPFSKFWMLRVHARSTCALQRDLFWAKLVRPAVFRNLCDHLVPTPWKRRCTQLAGMPTQAMPVGSLCWLRTRGRQGTICIQHSPHLTTLPDRIQNIGEIQSWQRCGDQTYLGNSRLFARKSLQHQFLPCWGKPQKRSQAGANFKFQSQVSK